MKIFITGGTGFLGRRIVRKLLEEGHTVRCLVRKPGGALELSSSLSDGMARRLEPIPGHLNSLSPEQLQGCDVVCHVAAALKGGTAALFTDNVIALRRVLKTTSPAG